MNSEILHKQIKDLTEENNKLEEDSKKKLIQLQVI